MLAAFAAKGNRASVAATDLPGAGRKHHRIMGQPIHTCGGRVHCFACLWQPQAPKSLACMWTAVSLYDDICKRRMTFLLSVVALLLDKGRFAFVALFCTIDIVPAGV
mgnify:CR=1 FL=1